MNLQSLQLSAHRFIAAMQREMHVLLGELMMINYYFFFQSEGRKSVDSLAKILFSMPMDRERFGISLLWDTKCNHSKNLIFLLLFVISGVQSTPKFSKTFFSD